MFCGFRQDPSWNGLWNGSAVSDLTFPYGWGTYRAHRATTERVIPGLRVRRTDPLTKRPIRLRTTVKGETQAKIELGKLLEKARDGRSPETGVTMAKLLDEYASIAQWDLSTRQNGETLDKLYARLMRCRDLSCTGRPFTEHRHIPVLSIDPADARPAWKQAAAQLTEAITSGVLLPATKCPLSPRPADCKASVLA